MSRKSVTTKVEQQGESWFKRSLNSTDLSADVKPLCFLLVVVAGILLCFAQWISKRLTSDLIDLFKILALLVGGGGAGWAAVERWKQVPLLNAPGATTTTTTSSSSSSSSSSEGGQDPPPPVQLSVTATATEGDPSSELIPSGRVE